MAKFCCPECFGDVGLRELIVSRSKNAGLCSFCGGNADCLIAPNDLVEFQTLISIYEPNNFSDKSLVEWLKEDWKLFSHPRMDVAHAKELLAEILDNGEIVRKMFSPSPSYHSDGLARWENLRDELMYKNRYFLDVELDKGRLKQLLPHLVTTLPAGSTWYRARLLNTPTPHSIAQMGAPDKRLALHGRANPPGIPYLYLSTQPDTSAAELRPHTGEIACVADFRIPSELIAIDLRDVRKIVSPFRLDDAGAMGQLRADIPFLERLGEELTRPVLPSGAAIDYIPSQYVCEFIKKEEYGGVLYSSSVSEGSNLALFNPEGATGGSISMFNIDSVSIKVSPR